ncbi:unnamed protein product [Musa acuminata subsp. burmannicoides]
MGRQKIEIKRIERARRRGRSASPSAAPAYSRRPTSSPSSAAPSSPSSSSPPPASPSPSATPPSTPLSTASSPSAPRRLRLLTSPLLSSPSPRGGRFRRPPHARPRAGVRGARA